MVCSFCSLSERKITLGYTCDAPITRQAMLYKYSNAIVYWRVLPSIPPVKCNDFWPSVHRLKANIILVILRYIA